MENDVSFWIPIKHWMRVPVAPHPHQYLVLSVFWILAILIGLTCNLWCWTSFHLIIWHLHVFFGKVLFLWPIFNPVVHFLICWVLRVKKAYNVGSQRKVTKSPQSFHLSTWWKPMSIGFHEKTQQCRVSQRILRNCLMKVINVCSSGELIFVHNLCAWAFSLSFSLFYLLNGIKGLELRWSGQIEEDPKIIRPEKPNVVFQRKSEC